MGIRHAEPSAGISLLLVNSIPSGTAQPSRSNTALPFFVNEFGYRILRGLQRIQELPSA